MANLRFFPFLFLDFFAETNFCGPMTIYKDLQKLNLQTLDVDTSVRQDEFPRTVNYSVHLHY